MMWRIWSGHGEQPTGQVDIRLRSGKEIKDTAARKWLWGRADNDNKNGGEIVAYRELMEAA